MAAPPNIQVRGIRQTLPAGYILGRQTGAGSGPPQLLSLHGLNQLGVATHSTVAAAVSSAVPSPDPANTVFAGPTSGGSAPPTFRALVAADIPSAPKWTTARTLSFTGDAAGSGSVDGSANVATTLTLATVNSNIGTFGGSTAIPVITVNAKGLITSVSTSGVSAGTTSTYFGAVNPTTFHNLGDLYFNDANSPTSAAGFVQDVVSMPAVPAFVQANVVSENTGATIVPQLSSTPTVGNLVLAFVTSTSNSLGTGTGWTSIGTPNSGTSINACQGFYRYVQAGDTATYPSITIGGASRADCITAEYSGVATPFSSALDLYETGTTTPTTSQTTMVSNELAVIYASGAFFAFTTPSMSGTGITQDLAASNTYPEVIGHGVYATAGATVQATLTNAPVYIQLLLKPGTSSPTPTWVPFSAATSGSAAKWTTARTLSYTGDATGSGSVDGSANVATTLTLATVNSNVGTFGGGTNAAQVTVNGKGLVTAAASVAIPQGTVTSVALSAPAEFTVSGSPVTGSGTLTFTKANQNANLVYAGPSSGGAAAPTFRSLVAADIPSLSGTYLTKANNLSDVNSVSTSLTNLTAVSYAVQALTMAQGVQVQNNVGIVNSTLNNISIGASALATNTTGNANVALGTDALVMNTTGMENVAIGYFCSYSMTTGSYNVGIGGGALQSVTTANGNVGVGLQTLINCTTGYENMALGPLAGYNVTTGATNAFIGFQAGLNVTTGNNNVCIGNTAQPASATASGQLSIQNIIYGINNSGTGSTVSTGQIGIGTAAPTVTFDVAGPMRSETTTVASLPAAATAAAGAFTFVSDALAPALGSAVTGGGAVVAGVYSNGSSWLVHTGGSASTATKWATARTLSFTGDATGSGSVDGSANVATALTLATVNSNVGTFGDSTHVAQVTVNANGLVTAASSVAITGTLGATTTVSGLPSAATAGSGARAAVTDALTPLIGCAVVGAGAVVATVYSNGTTWLVESCPPLVTTVAGLPASATANKGARAIVTDQLSPVTALNTTPVGGGSNILPVYSTGAGWKSG